MRHASVESEALGVRMSAATLKSALRLTGVCSLCDIGALWTLKVRQHGDVTLHPRALRGQGLTLHCGTTDFRTFQSTFVAQYHVPPQLPQDGSRLERILDLGANVGFVAADLAERYPEASVVAVEMDHDNFLQASANTVAFGERVRCGNAAAWIHDRGVCYALGADCDAYHVDEGDGAQSMAPSRTLDQLIDELPGKRADFVKKDVEGAESVLLSRQYSSWLARVGLLNVEVHEGAPQLAQVLGVLQARGFEVVMSTSHGSALWAWRSA